MTVALQLGIAVNSDMPSNSLVSLFAPLLTFIYAFGALGIW